MIRLIKPYINYNEVEQEFKEIFQSGWFTKGQYVEEFRKALKIYTGAHYSFLTTSATTALSVCLKILNIQKGDEVIVSDFSFPATSNVVEEIGAIPIFADVDQNTYNMKPEELVKLITSKTKAVIFVDALGNPSGIHEIKRICKQNNLPLIEDAACAIGSAEKKTKCGNIADLTCFSFHPRKLLTTGEGGAITTNNQGYAEALDIKLNHGAVFNGEKLDFIEYGYNYRMSELQAVMGIIQLRKIDEIVKSRNHIRAVYTEELEKIGFTPQQVLADVEYNVQSMVFRIPNEVNRDLLVQYLNQNNIEATLGTYCLSATTYNIKKYNKPNVGALTLQNKTITLPCHDDVDVKKIVECIKEFCIKKDI